LFGRDTSLMRNLGDRSFECHAGTISNYYYYYFDLLQTAGSISEFKFNKKRAKVLSEAQEFPEWGEGVIYWMFRDERVHGKIQITILYFFLFLKMSVSPPAPFYFVAMKQLLH
jgi:hypothetical protein